MSIRKVCTYVGLNPSPVFFAPKWILILLEISGFETRPFCSELDRDFCHASPDPSTVLFVRNWIGISEKGNFIFFLIFFLPFYIQIHELPRPTFLPRPDFAMQVRIRVQSFLFRIGSGFLPGKNSWIRVQSFLFGIGSGLCHANVSVRCPPDWPGGYLRRDGQPAADHPAAAQRYSSPAQDNHLGTKEQSININQYQSWSRDN